MPQLLVTTGNPAAGADYTITVPAGKYWRIVSHTAQLVTDANVAARNYKFIIDDGTTPVFETGGSGTGQAATSTCQYTVSPLAVMEAVSPASAVFKNFAIPEMVLAPGWRLRVLTGAIQVGDQWSNIRTLVDEELNEWALNRRAGR